jgi:hypothetical protein
MSHKNKTTWLKNKTTWLKNTSNGLIYQVNNEELPIYQKDKDLVTIATDKEVAEYQNANKTK